MTLDTKNTNKQERYTDRFAPTVAELQDALGQAGIVTRLVGSGKITAGIWNGAKTCDMEHMNVIERIATDDVTLVGCACDSRQVRLDNLFVCKGKAFRPAFALSAVRGGAVALMCSEGMLGALADTFRNETASIRADDEREGDENEPINGRGGGDITSFLPPTIVTADVDLRRAMGIASACAWGRPDRLIPVIGITGTKGKSTTSYMVRGIIDDGSQGEHAGIIGSIDTYDGVKGEESHNTTPEAPDLWRHVSNAYATGLDAMVMEVSSQGLKYDRAVGLHLTVGCFLNIGRDHISPIEHPTFEDYLSSKLRIFDMCDTAIVNVDTDMLPIIMRVARKCKRLVTVSAKGNDEADYFATDVIDDRDGVRFVAHATKWTQEVRLALSGDFNVENALAAIAICEVIGISREQILRNLPNVTVPGRMEFITPSDANVVALVDYAHNAMSYERLFSALRCQFGNKPLIAVFGCPGDKCQERRRDLPEMTAKWCDYAIYTEEDPAHESVDGICREMDENTPPDFPHEVIPDREQAIRRALEWSIADCQQKGAIICLLGKGDETRQHVGDRYIDSKTDARMYLDALHEFGH